MSAYSKFQQLGKVPNPKKTKKDGSKLSRTDEWARERAKLKDDYQEQGITRCEYVDKKGVPCLTSIALGFAHKKNRNNLQPGELGNINDTLLICNKHHQLIENDDAETERLFSKLRPIV
jgi:hypothetical protein